MTFGRRPDDRSSSSVAFGSAPAADRPLDAPYGGAVADGFGSYGPRGEGLGGSRAAAADVDPAVHRPGGHGNGDWGVPAPEILPVGGNPVGGGGAPAAAVDPASARLVGPPRIDFGEIVTGECATEDRQIFNLHPTYEAAVNVSLSGSPDLLLIGKPDRLHPSREGLGTPVTIAYQPNRRERASAVLRVTARWQTDAWPETTIEILVIGAAHAPGEPSHAQEEAAAVARAGEQQTAAADAARTRQLDDALARENQNDAPYAQGADNRLLEVYERAQHQLELLTAEQRQGVDDVGKEVDAFHRLVPRSQHSLLFDLAMFALDAATAGIAGALAVKLSKVVSHVVPGAARADDIHGAVVWSPGREKVDNPGSAAMLVESFKQAFKQAGKAGRETAFGQGAEAAVDGIASGETLDFFSGLASAVNWSATGRADALTHFRSQLLPTLRVDPEQAIAQMEEMCHQFADLADDAKGFQKDETRLAWMRFLSQHALGSLSAKQAAGLGLAPGADGAAITDVRGAAVPPMDGGAMASVDGMLDLAFEADYDTPERAVRVKQGRLTGVHLNMIETIKSRPLRELGIVIRAHGTVASGAPPIVVVRDEAGNVRFTDETGAVGQPSTWLSRKGGSLRPSPERQRLGAIALMDQLLDQTIVQLGASIETDHQDRGR